jgi:hypothetical protein
MSGWGRGAGEENLEERPANGSCHMKGGGLPRLRASKAKVVALCTSSSRGAQ